MIKLNAIKKKFNDDVFRILRKYELIKNEQRTLGAYLLFVDNISSLTGMQVGRFKTETMIVDSLNLNTDVLTEVEETLLFIRKNLMVEYIIYTLFRKNMAGKMVD